MDCRLGGGEDDPSNKGNSINRAQEGERTLGI